jgi:hypothetical protein
MTSASWPSQVPGVEIPSYIRMRMESGGKFGLPPDGCGPTIIVIAGNFRNGGFLGSNLGAKR